MPDRRLPYPPRQPSSDELLGALELAVKIANEAWAEWDRGSDHDTRVGKLLIALSGNAKGYRPETDRIHDVIRRATLPDRIVAALRDLSDNPHDTGAQIRAAAVLAQAEGREP